MVVSLRSKKLAKIFAEVWQSLPKQDRDSISSRTLLIVDNPIFLPKNHRPVWGAVICVRLRKTVVILYLSPRKLPQQPDSFVRYVIAHELAHAHKDHAKKLFRVKANEATRARFEKEAREQARRWGFPIVPPTQTPKRRKGVGYRKT
jgi:hypothetical protein